MTCWFCFADAVLMQNIFSESTSAKQIKHVIIPCTNTFLHRKSDPGVVGFGPRIPVQDCPRLF